MRATSGLATALQSPDSKGALVPFRGELHFTFAGRDIGQMENVIDAMADTLRSVGGFYEMSTVEKMVAEDVIADSPLANALQASAVADANPNSPVRVPEGEKQ